MKKCHYCGQQYGDNVTTCVTDGNPLIPLVDPDFVLPKPSALPSHITMLCRGCNLLTNVEENELSQSLQCQHCGKVFLKGGSNPNHWLWLNEFAGDKAPLRNGCLGTCLTGLGILTALTGMVILLDHFTCNQRVAGSALNLFIGMLLAFLGNQMRSFGGSLSSKSGWDVLATDLRAPVLYLRAFAEEGKVSFEEQSKGLDRAWYGGAAHSEEDLLKDCTREIGPFIAVGKPGEVFATGTAYRIYVKPDIWQQPVIELMARSSIVIFRAALTPALIWELRMASNLLGMHRIVVSIPLPYDDHRETRYRQFAELAERALGVSLPQTIGRAIFISFNRHWEPKLYGGAKTELSTDAAIAVMQDIKERLKSDNLSRS